MNRAVLCLANRLPKNSKQFSRSMLLLPYFRDDPFDRAFKEMTRLQRQLFDSHFGREIHPGFLRMFDTPFSRKNWNDIEKDLGVASAIGTKGFQVSIDVSQFKPNEITVKVVDNVLVIEAKHDERSEDDQSFVSRSFVRKWVLPNDQIDIEQLQSSLSSDGVLTITAPKLLQPDANKERIIPISQTGPAKDNVKDNTKEEKSDN